ncbi:MAG: TetR/AcrR family transcriptional regulator [Pseudomonadota bacterium]
MNKADENRQQIVAAVAAHLLREGFQNSGLRALARAAGRSDRMLMYYFSTKEEIVAEAMLLSAGRLAEELEASLPGTGHSTTHIIDVLMTATQRQTVQPVIRLWFEIVGLAMRGQEPYLTTARLILHNWHSWLKQKMDPKDHAESHSLLAQLEGQLLLSLLDTNAKPAALNH